MEELQLVKGSYEANREDSDDRLPDLTEYGIQAPFRFAIVGQTDSGKTYSILQRWLGGKISFWTIAGGGVREVNLQHCLYCNNGNVSFQTKQDIVQNFVQTNDQRVFHSDHFPTRDELFKFVGSTSYMNRDKKVVEREPARVRESPTKLPIITSSIAKTINLHPIECWY